MRPVAIRLVIENRLSYFTVSLSVNTILLLNEVILAILSWFWFFRVLDTARALVVLLSLITRLDLFDWLALGYSSVTILASGSFKAPKNPMLSIIRALLASLRLG